jgi:polyhydroxyalkanoate synthesis regulator phasin
LNRSKDMFLRAAEAQRTTFSMNMLSREQSLLVSNDTISKLEVELEEVKLTSGMKKTLAASEESRVQVLTEELKNLRKEVSALFNKNK